MQKERLLSAGIDVGTSTTKLVFSELEIENVAGFGAAPQIVITNKRLLYRSSIYRTPLLDEQMIHMQALQKIVEGEFERARIQPEDIQTGAIIITGETATKYNASEVIHTISQQMGDFLVATAGADLEGILAAKGSGAYTYSEQHPQKVIANVDIGGGTANIAVFKNKQLLGTCTLHVGGRLIEFKGEEVCFIAPPIARWLREDVLTIGTNKASEVIAYVVDEMCVAIYKALTKEIDGEHPLLLGHVPNWQEQVDTVMFSGGVAQFLRDSPQEMQDDLGFFIAQRLKGMADSEPIDVVASLETVAATVIGTSMQTTEISGATIHVLEEHLPIKNCPIVTIDFRDAQDVCEEIEVAVERAIQIYELRKDKVHVAWYMKNLPLLSFKEVMRMANCFSRLLSPLHVPFIFIFQQDYGRVFGQTLLTFHRDKTIISIDQIEVEQGDYIDIGRQLASSAVPVVIKTLAF